MALFDLKLLNGSCTGLCLDNRVHVNRDRTSITNIIVIGGGGVQNCCIAQKGSVAACKDKNNNLKCVCITISFHLHFRLLYI